MKRRSLLSDHQVTLMLCLPEPMEPKHRDVAMVVKVGKGYAAQSFNLPSTSLLETRIGYLAREALSEMALVVHGIGGDAADPPPTDVVRAVRDEFARGDVRVRVVLGTTRGGTNADADNCLKLVLDALCPVVFPNDRHVVHATVIQGKNAPTWVMITREADEQKKKQGAIAGAYVFPARNAWNAPPTVPILNAV